VISWVVSDAANRGVTPEHFEVILGAARQAFDNRHLMVRRTGGADA
jgi:hypothetical protein